MEFNTNTVLFNDENDFEKKRRGHVREIDTKTVYVDFSGNVTEEEKNAAIRIPKSRRFLVRTRE